MNTLPAALRIVASVICAYLLLMSTAIAEFPERTIRIIIPFPAGGSADVRTRQLADILSKQIKQQVVIDNRPGAAGNIGSALGAKAPPDGYTVLYTFTTSMAVNPHLYKDPGFHPLRDLIPFIVTLRSGAVLVVNAASSIRTIEDFVAHAKANPGKLNYGTAGPGSIQHLMGERLRQVAGIQMTAISYKGEAPLLTDLIGGQIDAAFGFYLAVNPFIASGKLRALAVSSPKRNPALPNVQTISESGYSEYDEVAWSGFAVPTGTPDSVVRKLHEMFRQAMQVSEFKREVEKSGAELVASTREYAARLVESDYTRYGKVVKALGISLE